MPKPEEIEEAIRRVLTEHIKRGELISPKVKQLLGGMLSSEAQTGERRPAPQKPTKPAPAKQAPVGRAVRATAPAARPAPATRRPAVHPSPRPPVVTRGIGAMTPAAAALAGEHEALMPPLPPLEPQVVSLGEGPMQAEKAALFPIPPAGGISVGGILAPRGKEEEPSISLAPAPTLEEPRPVPPPTPLEEQLRAKFNDPEFLKRLVVLSLNFPEQTQRLLGTIATVAPRALTAGERQFEAAWQESEDRRRFEKYAREIEIWRTDAEAKRELARLWEAQRVERAKALINVAGNINTLNDFVTVYNEAVSLPPHYFTLTRTLMISQLPYILDNIRAQGIDPRRALAELVQKGYLHESEARSVAAALEAKEARRNIFIGQLQMLKGYLDESVGIISGEEAGEYQTLRTEVEALEDELRRLPLIDIEGRELQTTINAITSRITQLASRIMDMRTRVETNVLRRVSDFLNSIRRLIGGVARGSRSEVTSAANMIRGIANTFKPLAASALIQRLEGLVNSPTELFEAAAESLENMAAYLERGNLKTEGITTTIAALREEANIYRTAAQEMRRKDEEARSFLESMSRLLSKLPASTYRAEAEKRMQEWNEFRKGVALQQLALAGERLELAREGLRSREAMMRELQHNRRISLSLSALRALLSVERASVSREDVPSLQEMTQVLNALSRVSADPSLPPDIRSKVSSAIQKVTGDVISHLDKAAKQAQSSGKATISIPPQVRQSALELIEKILSQLDSELLQYTELLQY